MHARTSPEEQFEKIRTLIFPAASDAAAALAREVKVLIEERNKAGRPAVLGLATGSTPVPFYRELIRLHREEGLSFKNVITFNLDEYYGLTRDHRESYFRFMKEQLFAHIDLPAENIHLPDGTVPLDEVFDHCAAYERMIDEAGGVDLQILGIGRTGHIGFNEPGSSRESLTRLIPLDRVTRQDAASDFLGEENVPRFAITMGVGTILRARKVALMAWGENKAEIVAKAVEGPETEAVSASFLQSHPDARFFLNAAAAHALTRIKLPWLVGKAEWTPDEMRRAVCWLSLKDRKPILKLQDEEYNENGMGELLTRCGSAYDLNIDIFNRQQHTISGWPGGKPNADDTSRPERAQPFPKTCLILAPEPEDDVLGMGGTIERLLTQGHRVYVACMTSGDLRVTDAEALRFARVLEETAEIDPARWAEATRYATGVIEEIETKGMFGDPPRRLRDLKTLIRRGEARDAAQCLGLPLGNIHFLDLPFYTEGRYRQFRLTKQDAARVGALLDRLQPHQIYITGDLADPSSVQGMAFAAFRQAMSERASAPWCAQCRVWLYRCHQRELEPHEVDMAVPMSPDQMARKTAAAHKFLTHSLADHLSGDHNRETARLYDRLGMAEYEAIEAFKRWDGDGKA
ncbi:MAG TPA: glucosamine-6-phosphate deaminase [Verrucomicrobiales bacterium]|jgi:glucosamine-6-phosphate deaminase|nr:glucosamine-6-phosphate deaminase [Verrucomicrobiales bacterium]